MTASPVTRHRVLADCVEASATITDGRMARPGRPLLTVWMLACTLAAGCMPPPVSGPRMPYEDTGACPFEGCVYRTWVANAGVAVKTERWIGAPVHFRLRRGDRARALTGVVVTMRPGRVRFKQPADLLSADGPLHVGAGDTLFLLTYHGEGVTTAWLDGRVYRDVDGSGFFDVVCQETPDACNGTIEEQPRRMWWVQVQNDKGAIGWTHEPHKFDNKNALE